MIYLIIGMSLLFAGTGFILTKKNAKYLLSGYNSMSDEERATFDLSSFLAFFRKFHLFLGISFLIIAIILNIIAGEVASVVFLGIYPLLAYIYFIFKSRKFQSGKNTKQEKAGIFVLAGTLVFVLILFASGLRENKLFVDSGEINIKGMYGEKLPLKNIESVKMVNKLPEIALRTNGFSVGEINKGYYKTRQGEVVKLILNSKEKPYILIVKKTGEKIFYTSKSKNNKQVFNSINRALEKNK